MPLKTEAKKSVLMLSCGDPHCVRVLERKGGSQLIKSDQSHKTDSPSDSVTVDSRTLSVAEREEIKLHNTVCTIQLPPRDPGPESFPCFLKKWNFFYLCNIWCRLVPWSNLIKTFILILQIRWKYKLYYYHNIQKSGKKFRQEENFHSKKIT